MAMILVIDSGNSNATFALYKEDVLCASWRCVNDKERSGDEYAVWLSQLMQLEAFSLEQIEECVIASVVPQTLFHLKFFCKRYLKNDPIIIGEVVPPMQILIDFPDELGADRMINAFAAFALFQRAAIIVDFGTATTCDVIDAEGNYRGGIIAPGVLSSLHTLHHSTAKLPLVNLEPPKKIIGTHTRAAIQSGVFWGSIGLVEGLISRIRQERQIDDDLILATGGFCSLFAEHCPLITHAIPELTLQGLQKMVAIAKDTR